MAAFASISALGATCAFGVTRAPAQTALPGVSVDWRAPAECPEPAFVSAEIARLLAGSSAPSARIDARADVTRVPGAWRVRLATGGGERTLEADSCRALAEATALILAMAVDPARVVANRAVATSATPTLGANASDAGASSIDAGSLAALSDAAPPDAASLDAARAPEPRDASAVDAQVVSGPAPSAASAPSAPPGPTAFAIGAGAIGDLGTLPFAGAGASLFAAWTPSPLRLEIAGAYFAANHSAPLANGSGGTFGLVTGGVRGCYDRLVTDVRFLPCLGLELDALRGEGTGVLTSSPATSLWIAVTAGLLFQWRIAPLFALDVRLDAAFPLQRPEFRIDDVALHRPAILSGRGVVGPEIRF